MRNEGRRNPALLLTMFPFTALCAHSAFVNIGQHFAHRQFARAGSGADVEGFLAGIDEEDRFGGRRTFNEQDLRLADGVKAKPDVGGLLHPKMLLEKIVYVKQVFVFVFKTVWLDADWHAFVVHADEEASAVAV